VPKGDQQHRRIAVTVSIRLGRFDQLPDLGLS
jgi:hypothetical protein